MFTLPYDLGDYTLESVLDIQGGRYLYRAKQKGTDRYVVLEIVRETDLTPEQVELFLEEVRIKTRLSESLSLTGTVYEAQRKDGYLFFTHQEAEGRSLDEIVREKGSLDTKELLLILKALVKTSSTLRQLGTAGSLIRLNDVHIDAHGRISVNNTAMPGNAGQDDPSRDMARIGGLLLPLITYGMPGATRMHTLFQWMIDGVDGVQLSWEQVDELIDSVSEQLGYTTANTTNAPARPARPWKKYAVIGGALAAAAGLIALLVLTQPEEQQTPVVDKKPVLSYRDHTDVEIALPDHPEPILCDAHEVTFKAYNRFLESLERMPDNTGLTQFAHKDQPDTKTSYKPRDWETMLDAARRNQTWNDIPLTMDSPVFNIDWWDANAYANWKERRLPTREEWQAIAEIANPQGKGDPYGPVAEYNRDLGSDNLCGFASGVSEWTSTLEKNPNQPMEPPQHVICGGDYQSPGIRHINHVANPGSHFKKTGFRTVTNKQ